jgi:pimeloyl-ACP methyl ester carboxylesterase
MIYSAQGDGFRLAYDRVGSGSPVVLLHGWPGDRTGDGMLVPLLTNWQAARTRQNCFANPDVIAHAFNGLNFPCL